MKLYVIEDEEDLKGKEILDVLILGVDVDEIIIITTDGGIFMANVIADEYKGTCEINLNNESRIKAKICHSKVLKQRLLAMGDSIQDDLDGFIAEHIVQMQREADARRKRDEQYERELYLRLKNKYERGETT